MAWGEAILALIATAVEVVNGHYRDCGQDNSPA